MNDQTITPELQQRLITLLDYVGDKAKAAEGFAIEQAPLVAREIVAWQFWSSIFLIFLFVMLGAVAWSIAVYCWRTRNDWFDPDFAAMVACFAAVAGIALPLAGGGTNGYIAVKATVAPRLVIIDYIKTIR